MQVDAFGSFSVHVWWILSGDMITFLLEESRGVSWTDFVNKMQIQALMAAVYVMGERVCFSGTLMKYYSNILQEVIMFGRLCY